MKDGADIENFTEKEDCGLRSKDLPETRRATGNTDDLKGCCFGPMALELAALFDVVSQKDHVRRRGLCGRLVR
ncbi:MAG: hypothetical protein R8G34_01650 [Paracoccaceae bacterium]|nr:hypothetical protein [Paracoccaceae bacterium]